MITKLLLILALGSVPLLLWGGFFYYSNPRKQPLKEISKIFLLGTLSIVPVIYFHQWLLGDILVTLKSWWSVFEGNFMSAFLELSLMLMFIFFFVTVFSILSFIFGRLIFRSSSPQSSHSRHGKLYNLAPILVFFALFLLVEAVTDLTTQQSFLLSLLGSTITFAVLEEYFKFAINPFLSRQKINSVGTAMVYALYVGLAFAFVENLMFFYVMYGSADFQRVVVYRSLATALLHIGASGILGYFYGLSLFSNSMLATYEIEKGQYQLPFWLKPFFKKETFIQSLSVTQGFFLAALFHTTFNTFLHLQMKTLAIVLVIVLTALVVLLLRSHSSQVQYGLIGTDTMPQVDFEKLRLQISFLKEMQGIQAAKV